MERSPVATLGRSHLPAILRYVAMIESVYDPELVPLFLEIDFSEFDLMLQLNRMQDQSPHGP